MLSFLAPTLRSRLVLLVLFAVLPSIGLTLYTGLEEHRIQLDQMEKNTLRLTRLAAADLTQVIEGAHQMLSALSQLKEVKELNTKECSALFEKLLAQYRDYVNIGLIDDGGNIICSGTQFDMPVDSAHHAYVRRALKTGDFVVSGFQIDASTGTPVIVFVAPVFDDWGWVKPSAVFAALDLASFKRIDIAAQLPTGAVFQVLDYNGVVLARYPEPEKWIGQFMPAELVVLAGMGEGRESLVALQGGDLAERLYGITTIRAAPETDIYVSIGMSPDAAFGPIESVLKRNVAGVGLVGILALLAAWIGNDVFILRRLKALATATKRLASGDLGVRIGLSGDRDELSVLAASFNEMAMSLDKRTTEVRRAETKYRTLVEQMPMITYIATLDKTISTLYISPQIEAVLGYSPEEWLADPELWVQLLHPEDRDRVLTKVQSGQLSPDGVGFQLEYRISTRSGTILWLRDEAIAVKNELNEPDFLQGIMFDITERKRFEEELKGSHERMRELAGHIEAAREEERTRIARDIHDELGQVLTCLKIDLSWMDKKLQTKGQAARTELLLKKITAMKETIDNTVQVVRKISTELRPVILDHFGLPAAIEWQAAEFQNLTDIQCQFSTNPENLGLNLDGKSSSAIFRIFQELLTNIARHAKASKVTISLGKGKKMLNLEVRDNGRGITERENLQAKSFGLLGVRERVALLNGKFSIKGVEGEGTTVTVRIPFARINVA
jgi:PAS domain S-box-containing protein